MTSWLLLILRDWLCGCPWNAKSIRNLMESNPNSHSKKKSTFKTQCRTKETRDSHIKKKKKNHNQNQQQQQTRDQIPSGTETFCKVLSTLTFHCIDQELMEFSDTQNKCPWARKFCTESSIISSNTKCYTKQNTKLCMGYSFCESVRRWQCKF